MRRICSGYFSFNFSYTRQQYNEMRPTIQQNYKSKRIFIILIVLSAHFYFIQVIVCHGYILQKHYDLHLCFICKGKDAISLFKCGGLKKDRLF